MADEQTLNHIMNEYEELRISAANERKKRIEKVNKKIPRVAEIDREIFQCGMENTKRIFKNPDKADEYNRDFKENLRKLENEKSNLLKVNGISADYNKYKYKCENCSDTGYDKDGKKCQCFKQKLINAAYSVSNIEETIKTQNFDTFSFDYYSKDVGENGVSVYDNMTKIYNNCKRFCDNFDNETMVIYIRATKLFSINEDYKFGRNTDRSVIDNIYKADLLIIDDLGTEPFNKNNLAFLFDVINERTANNKKIIINTNLQISEITKMYSMRFTSRLYEYFMMYKFYGEDIRIQKLRRS
jgi:DNA replication protein DnaC